MRFVVAIGIGVGKIGYPISPPSEPYVRFSRIRLSGRWFTAGRTGQPTLGSRMVNSRGWRRRRQIFTSSSTRDCRLPAYDPHPSQVPPRRTTAGVSGLFSPSDGHSPRSRFPRYARHVSTFLRPFAPRALPCFPATIAALTPGWPALRHKGMNTVHAPARSP